MKKVALVSKVNYPVPITYGKDKFMLPPKKKTDKEFNLALLGPINDKEVAILK